MSCLNNLKQLGLALHNFTSAGYFPRYNFDFPTNPDLVNPYGDQKGGNSLFALILPYIEQGNIYAQMNTGFEYRSGQLPPPLIAAKSTAGQNNIKTFLCPSSPDLAVDYGPYCRQDSLNPTGGRSPAAPIMSPPQAAITPSSRLARLRLRPMLAIPAIAAGTAHLLPKATCASMACASAIPTPRS